MIIITSTVTIKADHYDEAVAFSKLHVAASRLEDGCLSHRYFEDPENPRTLIFLEYWKDQAAIDSHFAQPYSLEFAKAFRSWCEGNLNLDFHHVSATNQLDLGSD
ncbi:MAG: antibiotic biosynthesis monooxygenase [Deltaproteobacteria bacterium]|nr:antibiotic biosynthesis monooxygenase [Deltaproteobacteria bacterium]MBW2388709.1 antibiotic biosynthesis monooxygenase [Deltaproteobacteria bacterium]